jgi:t-SNARE complex subunit (syntaxin)
LREVDFVKLWYYWWDEAVNMEAEANDIQFAARMYEHIVERVVMHHRRVVKNRKRAEPLATQALLRRL